jgi:LysM domain-containing protein
VALRFGTTVDSLLTLNPSVDPNALRVGQRIRIR